MAPYAIQTMSKLVEVFWSALEGNGEDDDDDGYQNSFVLDTLFLKY